MCNFDRILLAKKTRKSMTLLWRLSAGSSSTCCFLDMWKILSLENHFNCLVVSLGQFMLRFVTIMYVSKHIAVFCHVY